MPLPRRLFVAAALLFMFIWLIVSMKMFIDQRNHIISTDKTLLQALPAIREARTQLPQTQSLLDAGVPLVEAIRLSRVRATLRTLGRTIDAVAADDKLPRLLASSVNLVEAAQSSDLLGNASRLIGRASHTVDYTHDLLTELDRSGLLGDTQSAVVQAEALLMELRDGDVVDRLVRAGVDVRLLRRSMQELLSVQRRTFIILSRSLAVQEATLDRLESIDSRLGGAPPATTPAPTAAAPASSPATSPSSPSAASPEPSGSAAERLPAEVRELLDLVP